MEESKQTIWIHESPDSKIPNSRIIADSNSGNDTNQQKKSDTLCIWTDKLINSNTKSSSTGHSWSLATHSISLP